MARKTPVQFGDRFGRLVVIGKGEDRINKAGHTIYRAKVACICGNQLSVAIKSLQDGNTKSCGCMRADSLRISPSNLKHGMVGTPTYRTWRSMKERCLNPRNPVFRYYGARGIAVCERWMKFENFFADMGERPVGMSLDRIDGEGHYEPDNCRWATDLTQAFNQSQTKPVVFHGKVMSFSQAAREIGRVPATLREFASEHGLSHQETIDRYRKRRGP